VCGRNSFLINMTAQPRTWVIYGTVLSLTLGWLCALWAAPQLLCSGHAWAALLLYRAFALVCHQRPERSFHWCGSPLAVCVRCTGIYTGALLGLLLYPWQPGIEAKKLPARRYLLGAMALLWLDWALGATGLLRNNIASRLATGLLLGLVLVFYLFPMLVWGGNPVLQHKFKT
jgi:uncharacterized membrane protein